MFNGDASRKPSARTRKRPKRLTQLPNIGMASTGDGTVFLEPRVPPGHNYENNTKDPFDEFPDQCSFEKEGLGAVCLVARELDPYKRRRLGQGAYGTVDHYCVKTSQHKDFHLAIKKIKILIGGRDARHTNELTMRDRTVALKSRECIYTVEYYDTMVYQGEIWIVMELMDTSLDKFYPIAHQLYHATKDTQSQPLDSNFPTTAVPEDFVKLLVYSLIEALHYLKKIGVIHRDVKPSNILISQRFRQLKLCDFGISGELSNSIVSSKVGCQPYMAPERVQQKPCETTNRICVIDGELVSTERVDRPGYGIKSDVWSLGITITEVINGSYPYGEGVKKNAFNLISAIVRQEAPAIIDPQRYSPQLVSFVDSTLQKEVKKRLNYDELARHPFYPRSGPPPEAPNLPYNSMPDKEIIGRFFDSVFAHLSSKDRSGPLEPMQE